MAGSQAGVPNMINYQMFIPMLLSRGVNEKKKKRLLGKPARRYTSTVKDMSKKLMAQQEFCLFSRSFSMRVANC